MWRSVVNSDSAFDLMESSRSDYPRCIEKFLFLSSSLLCFIHFSRSISITNSYLHALVENDDKTIEAFVVSARCLWAYRINCWSSSHSDWVCHLCYRLHKTPQCSFLFLTLFGQLGYLMLFFCLVEILQGSQKWNFSLRLSIFLFLLRFLDCSSNPSSLF